MCGVKHCLKYYCSFVHCFAQLSSKLAIKLVYLLHLNALEMFDPESEKLSPSPRHRLAVGEHERSQREGGGGSHIYGRSRGGEGCSQQTLLSGLKRPMVLIGRNMPSSFSPPFMGRTSRQKHKRTHKSKDFRAGIKQVMKQE